MNVESNDTGILREFMIKNQRHLKKLFLIYVGENLFMTPGPSLGLS